MCQVFPESFIANLNKELGEDADRLLAALDGEPSVSVRYNSAKGQPKEGLRKVAWCEYGRYLEQRPYFTADPLFQAGCYYVQEASSMFVEHLYRQSVGEQQGVRLLDLCAAPGGKTTLYSSLVGRDGVVVANEVIRKRVMVLADNVMRWGAGNVVVTNNDPSHFGSLNEWFDVVAVDAPCSGEGMFRKDHAARDEWSEDNVKLCAARQRRILEDVWCTLRPGGVLIYSTCTFNRAEDEENVEWLVENFDCEPIHIDMPEEWGVVRSEASGVECFHFYPHSVEGEGFFAAVLRKGGEPSHHRSPKPRKNPFADLPRQSVAELSAWVAHPSEMVFKQVGENCYGYYSATFVDVRQVSEQLTVVHSGVCMGQIFGKKLRPDHSLALFCEVNRRYGVEVDLATAQNYLARRDVDATLFTEGINLLLFEGVAVGWVKRVGGRVNSLLPKQFAINNLTAPILD